VPGAPVVTCRHGHVVNSAPEVEHCAAGHEHCCYVCRMRRGNRPCGEQVVTPAYGPGCVEDDRD